GFAGDLERRADLEVAGRQREDLVGRSRAAAAGGALALALGPGVLVERLVDLALDAEQVAEPVARVGGVEQHAALARVLAEQRVELALGLVVRPQRLVDRAALLVDRVDLGIEP